MMDKLNLKVQLALAVGLALFGGCMLVCAEKDCGTGAVRCGFARENVSCHIFAVSASISLTRQNSVEQ